MALNLTFDRVISLHHDPFYMFVIDSSCRVEGVWLVRNNVIKYALLDAAADVADVTVIAVAAAVGSS